MKRVALAAMLDAWLMPQAFKDAAENGLQIEGKDEISRVVCGVSANLALLDAAIEAGADAVVVHHGLVWGGGIKRLDGWLKQRIARALRAELNLFAYHLPLDAWPLAGNNAGLLRALEGNDAQPFGAYRGQRIGARGTLAPVRFDAFVKRVKERVGTPLAVFGDPARVCTRIGVCSGGAPDILHDAVAEGLDVYVTGEATEWVKAVAEETGVCFVAAGHHATERFGPRGLAEELVRVGVDARFIDVDNPC